jgi:peptidoglycan hydrolase-like protein with peptidoglycan-binding domain
MLMRARWHIRAGRRIGGTMKNTLIAAAVLFASAAVTPGYAQAPMPPSQPTIQQPLSPDGVRAVQQQLRQGGFYRGPIDGRWGRSTVAAIGAFQENRRLPVTWQLDADTARALGLDPQYLAGTAPPPGPAPYPSDVASGQVLPRDVVRRVQEQLARAGFNPGRRDGIWGSRTEEELRNFQQSRGLQVTGDLNPRTTAALGLDPVNLAAAPAPVAPPPPAMGR